MPSKPKAPESTSFPVRITKSDHQWLVALAQENGVEVSQIIRWAVTAFRQYVDAHGGKLHLPIDIREFWAVVQKTPLQQAEDVFRSRLNEDEAEYGKPQPPQSRDKRGA